MTRNRRPPRIVVARPIAIALLLVGALVVGCNRAQNQYAPPPPPKVVVSTPVVKPVTMYHEYTGATQASEAVQLRARVQGYLQKIGFKDGVNVDQDQVLFVIDPRPYQAALDQAKADLESKQAVVTQTESIYKRDLVLLPTKAKSQEEADVDRGNWLVAKANVEQSQANIRQAELNLEYCEIRAPFAGRMGRHMMDIGNLVTSDAVLATIARYDPMFVYFNVSEPNYLDFLNRQRNGGAAAGGGITSPEQAKAAAEGQKPPDYPVELALTGEKDYSHKGVINFLDNTVDPNSGTILVRGEFKNPPPYYLVPGLYARVRVPVRVAPNSIVVPAEAIANDQAGPYVLVVDSNNVVQHRAVEPGEETGDERVIDKGLKPGERFVVEGLQRVRPGEKVVPEQAPPERIAGAGKSAK